MTCFSGVGYDEQKIGKLENWIEKRKMRLKNRIIHFFFLYLKRFQRKYKTFPVRISRDDTICRQERLY